MTPKMVSAPHNSPGEILMGEDFFGLGKTSEGLAKLAAVVKDWWSEWREPRRIAQVAAARATEFRIVSASMEDAGLPPVKAAYVDGKVSLESGNLSSLPEELRPLVLERTISRLVSSEVRRQLNLETVVFNAAQILKDEESVSAEELDSDWMARFFRIAEDLNNEQMRLLWGRLLAGEVKRTGSYSLRTLDVLRNMSQHEAEIFARVGRFAIKGPPEQAFLLNQGQFLEQAAGIKVKDLLLLREVNIISPSDVMYVTKFTPAVPCRLFTCGSTAIVVEVKAGKTLEIRLPAIAYTMVGGQLLELLDKNQADINYVERFAHSFKEAGVAAVRFGPVLEELGDEVRVGDLEEIQREGLSE